MLQFLDRVFPEYPAPVLEPEFVPAVLWDREYLRKVKVSGRAKEIALVLARSENSISVKKTFIFDRPSEKELELSVRHAERLIKTMLWCYGGSRVGIYGDSLLARKLAEIYSETGSRSFDRMMMRKIYGSFTVEELAELPEASENTVPAGHHHDGCRIGFDLGGSNRKCVALQDGKVVFSESLPWSPYFEKDPEYHKRKIQESLLHAAEHLPRVDAIGGSTAGVIIANQLRISSLFRGIPDNLFEKCVTPIFLDLQKEWKVPFSVANDGEVTALAGAISTGSTGVLGISMGTSTAGGYVTPNGNITPWLNELAFIPVDFRDNAPADEWSGDLGCGVQYFSIQGAARLAERAGNRFPQGTPDSERCHLLLDHVSSGDEKAEKVFRSIGTAFGYMIARCAEFYEMKNLLLLGGVASGKAGTLIQEESGKVLREVFPEIQMQFLAVEGANRSFGQAEAAATLPAI